MRNLLRFCDLGFGVLRDPIPDVAEESEVFHQALITEPWASGGDKLSAHSGVIFAPGLET